jgi:arylsulfatase A-like enzyme
MLRFFFLALAASLILSACQTAAPSHSSPSSSPNIILIFADDLGYGDLSSYGHPTIQTPRIDQMARGGIRLTSFYTAASVCTPSRAGLLTGRYPIRFGMAGNLGPESPGGIPASETTMAEALKEQGYRTACFGKWHLGSVPGYFPTENGFDEYLGILYSNDMMPPWVNTDRPLHLYRDTIPTDEYPVDQTTLTERYTEEAIRFIKAGKEEPFFVYLPHAMPHLPVSTSDKFSGTSEGGRYGDVIETLDWSVGRLLDVLEEEGLTENTLVIFTSDNGPWNQMPPRMYNTEPVELWDAGSEGPLRGSKASTWEGGLRVPFVAYWPGTIPAGQLSSEMVATLDIFPTIAALTGAELPTAQPLDGQNMWPLLRGEKQESPREQVYYFQGKRLEGVRKGIWKLMHKPISQREEPELQLFHLGQDPFEKYDVAQDHPEIVAELLTLMDAFGQETGANRWETEE